MPDQFARIKKAGHLDFKKYLTVAFAAAVMVGIHLLPLPEPLLSADGLVYLTAEGKTSLALLAFVIILWMTEALPFSITALFGLLLAYAFRLASLEDIVSYGFGSPVIIFFIGVLTLSSGLTRSGLAGRFTTIMINRVGAQPRKIVFAFMALGAFMSMWIVNMSVAAILLPMATTILKRVGHKPLESNFGRALMIAVAWGPAIGGIATPVGNGANIVALGYLRELAGIPIDFLTWMVVGVPAALMILPLAYLILIKVFPPETIDQEQLNHIKMAANTLVRPAATEWKTLFIFLLAVILWLGDPLLSNITGIAIPLELVALGAAIALFLPGMRIMTWKEAQSDIDWGGIILIAAGLSLGMLIFETGAARWLAIFSFSPIGGLTMALRIFLAVLIVELLKVFFSSNTVTGVILIPMVIALAVAMGLDPWYLAGPVTIATSMAFILVTSSPTNIIPYASGYFTIKDFAHAGIILTLVVPFCVTVAFLLFAPLVW